MFKAGDKVFIRYVSGWGGKVTLDEGVVLSVDEPNDLVVVEGRSPFNRFTLKGENKAVVMDCEVTILKKEKP